MALMLGALYRALIAAHVPEDEAQKAAEEVAGYDTRLSGIETRLSLLTWMVGTLVALQIALGVGNLWLSYTILARMADLAGTIGALAARP